MNKIMLDEKLEGAEKSNSVSVHLRVLPRTPALYVQYMAVSHSPDEVILSFFEGQPLVQSPEALEELKKTGLVADCVARIAVTPKRFVDFVRVMSETAKAYSNDPDISRNE